MSLDHRIPAVRVGRDNRLDRSFLPHPEPWMFSGLCGQSDPDTWFPRKGGDARPAKRICLSCSVLAECAAFALARDDLLGVWAGMSERERRLARNGAPKPLAHPPEFYRERADQIRAMAAAGKSVAEIAAAVDAPPARVRDLLRRDRRNGQVAS